MLTRTTLVLCAAGAIGLAGCGNGSVLSPDRPRSTLDLGIVDLDSAPTFVETDSNDSLDLAEAVLMERDPEVISGAIRGGGDVDVFDLGPMATGDRVLVSVSPGSSLKGAIAVFDDTGSTLLVNDHQNVYLGLQGPFVDVIFRRPSRQCLVAMSSTPGFNTQGDYVLGATVSPDVPIPSARPDTVVLDFEGGSGIRIGSRAPVNVPRFDAGDIDPGYAGLTEMVMREVVRRVRTDFAGLDVTILSTSEGASASSQASRIYFGAVDNALLGVAEGVDEYNAASRQRAIVFIESFAAFMRLEPSVDEMTQALANVASHEIGHLLGLVHSQDPADVMDVTASLNQLLRDQTFGKSPIYRVVFPIGYQDSAQLLLDSVGGDPLVLFGQVKQREITRARALDDPPAPPARDFAVLGSCGCGNVETLKRQNVDFN